MTDLINNENIEQLTGEFVKTIYKAQNYMVSKFNSEDGPITVTGPSFDYETKQKYIIKGFYNDHPKYGFQFNMITIEKYLPSKKDEIISFLKSKAFKGIGQKVSEKIYDYFKDDTLLILKENPQKILELNLTNKQIESIINGFNNLNDPQNEIIFYLVSNGFNNIDAQKIFNKFKMETIKVGKENPFRFYNEVYGINFEKVKQFANKLEFDDSENKYKEAFLLHLINDYTFNTGDTYIKYDDLISIISNYGTFTNLDKIINNCIEKRYIFNDNDSLYLFDDYQDELFISNFLREFKTEFRFNKDEINNAIELSENEFNIKYDVLQKQAISNFFTEDFSIIIGGPGTGKTTIVKAMASIYKQLYPYGNMIVVAPTGRAAKRINEICDVEAKTIHSLLKWNLETNTFIYDIDNPILYDAIIIDEFSMVDNNLFASLLKACSRVKKICIIGDDNQLPSIRPGDVLNDLIESNRFIKTKLISNYRQSDGSEIISLADDIINNDIIINKYHKDIKFYNIKKDNFDLVKLIQNDINNGYTLDEIQVLTPMYKGLYGIDNLNKILQAKFNPASKDKNEKEVGQVVYREKDKILQLKNRPNDDVYNGDIGILEDIDTKEKSFLINYQNTYCFYSYDELVDISLAYAMSVHKAQGSEYQIVYFILTKNNLHMLNKKLIYTAISRAKIKLVIISEDNVLLRGINNKLRRRNTGLLKRLIYE